MALERVNTNLETEEREFITKARAGTVFSEAQWVRLAMQEKIDRDIALRDGRPAPKPRPPRSIDPGKVSGVTPRFKK